MSEAILSIPEALTNSSLPLEDDDKIHRIESRIPVSVIIVNYNSGKLLLNCIESVLESDFPVDIFVVDNNSDDESINLINKKYGTETNVQIIRNAINTGFAHACNQAVRLAQGKYWLFLNPDCQIKKETISEMVTVLRNNPKVAMAGPLIVNPDGTEQRGCRRTIPTPWRSFIRAFGLSRFENVAGGFFKDFLLHKEPLPEDAADVEAISGAFMIVRREAIQDTGLLDDGYFLHCEDLDWCMRFREKGWRILFVPDTVITHRKGGCSENKQVFVLWHMHKGMIRFYKKFFRKRYPGVLMWLVIFAVWMRFSALAVYHTFKNLFVHTKEFIKSKPNAFRSF